MAEHELPSSPGTELLSAILQHTFITQQPIRPPLPTSPGYPDTMATTNQLPTEYISYFRDESQAPVAAELYRDEVVSFPRPKLYLVQLPKKEESTVLQTLAMPKQGANFKNFIIRIKSIRDTGDSPYQTADFTLQTPQPVIGNQKPSTQPDRSRNADTGGKLKSGSRNAFPSIAFETSREDSKRGSFFEIPLIKSFEEYLLYAPSSEYQKIVNSHEPTKTILPEPGIKTGVLASRFRHAKTTQFTHILTTPNIRDLQWVFIHFRRSIEAGAKVFAMPDLSSMKVEESESEKVNDLMVIKHYFKGLVDTSFDLFEEKDWKWNDPDNKAKSGQYADLEGRLMNLAVFLASLWGLREGPKNLATFPHSYSGAGTTKDGKDGEPIVDKTHHPSCKGKPCWDVAVAGTALEGLKACRVTQDLVCDILGGEKMEVAVVGHPSVVTKWTADNNWDTYEVIPQHHLEAELIGQSSKPKPTSAAAKAPIQPPPASPARVGPLPIVAQTRSNLVMDWLEQRGLPLDNVGGLIYFAAAAREQQDIGGPVGEPAGDYVEDDASASDS